MDMFFWALWAGFVLGGILGFMCGRMDRADKRVANEKRKEEK